MGGCCAPSAKVVDPETVAAMKVLEDYNLTTTVSLPRLRQVFTAMDHDKSQSIDMRELYNYWRTKESVFLNNLFARIDRKNGNNGSLIFSQFCELLCQFTTMTHDEILRLMFTWLDLDKTGKLTADNLRLLVGKLGAGANDSPGARLGGKSAMVVVNEILEKFDANGDGVIDFDEFKEINTHFPELLGSVFFLQSLVATSTGLPLGRGLGDKARLVFRESGTLVQPQLGRAKSSRSVKLHPHSGVGSTSAKHHVHAGQHGRGMSRHERKALAISKSFSADPSQPQSQPQQPGHNRAPTPTSPAVQPTSPVGAVPTTAEDATAASATVHLRKPSVSTVVVKTVTTVETITTTTVLGDAADVAAVVAAAESADSTPPSTHTGNTFVPLGSAGMSAGADVRASSPIVDAQHAQQQQPPNSRQNSHPTTIGGRPAASRASLRRSTGGSAGGSTNSILNGLTVRSSGSPRGPQVLTATTAGVDALSPLPAGLLSLAPGGGALSPTLHSFSSVDSNATGATAAGVPGKQRSSSITRVTTTRTVREETYSIPSPRVEPIKEVPTVDLNLGLASKKEGRQSQSGPLTGKAAAYVVGSETVVEGA